LTAVRFSGPPFLRMLAERAAVAWLAGIGVNMTAISLKVARLAGIGVKMTAISLKVARWLE